MAGKTLKLTCEKPKPKKSISKNENEIMEHSLGGLIQEFDNITKHTVKILRSLNNILKNQNTDSINISYVINELEKEIFDIEFFLRQNDVEFLLRYYFSK